jgi:hypothetical protein
MAFVYWRMPVNGIRKIGIRVSRNNTSTPQEEGWGWSGYTLQKKLISIRGEESCKEYQKEDQQQPHHASLQHHAGKISLFSRENEKEKYLLF